MIKILILEDDLRRIMQFRQNFKNASLFFVQTAFDAIEALKKDKFDWIFLDHDLGGGVYLPSDEKSGYEVAKWLELNPKHQTERICLHSLNPSGVQNMAIALPKAHLTPFAWTKEVDFSKYNNK